MKKDLQQIPESSKSHRRGSFTIILGNFLQGHNEHDATGKTHYGSRGGASSFAPSLDGVEAGLETAEPPPLAPPSSLSLSF